MSGGEIVCSVVRRKLILSREQRVLSTLGPPKLINVDSRQEDLQYKML